MRKDYVASLPQAGKPQTVNEALGQLKAEHDKAQLLDAIINAQSTGTEYTAPKEHQKWRAMNLFTLHRRYLKLTIPESYFQAMACVIEHVNPTTGRSDTSQRKMAAEIGVCRKTLNKALGWWTKHTKYLRKGNRAGSSSAYHPQWDEIEAEWASIQERIQAVIKRGV